MFKINDRIYGSVVIKYQVLYDLIHSRPVQRLKSINQAGASQYLFDWKNVSRFEHSVGVMLLLRMFGASLEEQIAGLLHDVSHTAFSHVADFVFSNPDHEFHELHFKRVIRSSDIPDILKKYDIPLPKIFDVETFTRLEKQLPDLCADRIDYALRDYYIWKQDKESIEAKLGGLIIYKKEFVFSQPIVAESFARDYLHLDKTAWAHPREVAAYMLLAQALHHALDKKYISTDDFFTDDKQLLQLLKERGDVYIRKKLSYLTPHFWIEPATKDHHHLFIKTKVRAVDPKVLVNRKTKRLSTISPKFKLLLEEHQKQADVGWYVYIRAK